MSIYYTDATTLNNGSPNQKSKIFITDGNGDLLAQYYLGNYTINTAELLGIYFIIERIKPVGVTIYSDSKIAVNWVNKGFHKKSKASDFQKEVAPRISKYLEKNDCQLKYIARDLNLAGRYIDNRKIAFRETFSDTVSSYLV